MEKLIEMVENHRKITSKLNDYANTLKGNKVTVFFYDEHTIGTIHNVNVDKMEVAVILHEIVDYEYPQINGHPLVNYKFKDIEFNFAEASEKENISEFAQRIISLWHERYAKLPLLDFNFQGNINNVCVLVNKNTTVSDIINQYEKAIL